jgi:hypothetical protein
MSGLERLDRFQGARGGAPEGVARWWHWFGHRGGNCHSARLRQSHAGPTIAIVC